MAVGRLSGAWIYRVVSEVYPAGVLRRALLDHFAELLVSKRSSRGAKGRLARKMYNRLLSLQRRGLISQEEGIVRTRTITKKSPPSPHLILGPILERALFRAMLAQDGLGDSHTPEKLREARWDFLGRAIESGLSISQGAEALGISATEANALLGKH